MASKASKILNKIRSIDERFGLTTQDVIDIPSSKVEHRYPKSGSATDTGDNQHTDSATTFARDLGERTKSTSSKSVRIDVDLGGFTIPANVMAEVRSVAQYYQSNDSNNFYIEVLPEDMKAVEDLLGPFAYRVESIKVGSPNGN